MIGKNHKIFKIKLYNSLFLFQQNNKHTEDNTQSLQQPSNHTIDDTNNVHDKIGESDHGEKVKKDANNSVTVKKVSFSSEDQSIGDSSGASDDDEVSSCANDDDYDDKNELKTAVGSSSGALLKPLGGEYKELAVLLANKVGFSISIASCNSGRGILFSLDLDHFFV